MTIDLKIKPKYSLWDNISLKNEWEILYTIVWIYLSNDVKYLSLPNKATQYCYELRREDKPWYYFNRLSNDFNI